MAFRNPLYLNLELLQNVADYYGIELPADAQVTRRTSDERRGRAGLSRGVDVGRETGSTDEVTEVYTTTVRPVRVMNDVIDALLGDSDLVDLTSDPSVSVKQRDVVQIDGRISLSPVTEIGALMATLLPLLMDQVASGGDLEDLDATSLGEAVLGSGAQNFVHVFELDDAGTPFANFILLNPPHLFGSATTDDIDGDVTAFATVDRVVTHGRIFSLERHLLPGLNRIARRAMGTSGLADLLDGASEMLGRPVDESTISIHGPAVLLTPIAIY